MARIPKCEKCGAPHDGTPQSSMPYSWSPDPVTHYYCRTCSSTAYAEHQAKYDKKMVVKAFRARLKKADDFDAVRDLCKEAIDALERLT